jgi:periplasmic protein TonB
MQVKKSPKVDLERRKFIFLQLGFVLALAICLVAFEWSTEEVGAGALGDLSMEEVWEEEIESTIQEEEIPEPEPEPEPEIEEVIEELVIVEDDAEVDDRLDIDSEANEKTQTQIVIQNYEEEEEEVEPIDFAVVEDKPLFPGGDAALMSFIANNTKYPEIAKENGIQGRVFVQFIIDEKGKVTNVKIARGVDPYLDQEALRVVKLIPDWKPGKQRGKAVPVNFIVPINFRLY